MRLVDLHIDREQTLDVVLHPRLTVLTGVPSDIQLVADSLARAFTLAGNGVGGTVDYSGFHMPLDQTTVVSLDLHGEGFRVLTPAEVPEPDEAGTEVAERDVEDRRIGWQRRLEAAEAQIASLRARLDATAAAVRVGQDELTRAETAADQLEAAAAAALERPEQLANEISLAQQDLAAADSHLLGATQLAPTFVAAFDPDSEGLKEVRIGVDPDRHRDLLEHAAGMELLPAERLEELRRWLEDVASGTAEPNAALAEMLEEIDAVEKRWAEVSSVGVEEEPEVAEARQRNETLSARLAALMELADSGILADRARSEIDAAHDDRVRIEGERHLRSGGLEEAVAQEESTLGKYGFDSYLEYTIALSTRSVGDAVGATLERVRTEQVGAADALEAVRGEAAARRTAISEERRRLRERILERTGLAADELTVDVMATVPEIPSSFARLPAEVDAALKGLADARSGILDSLQALEGAQNEGTDRPERLRQEAEEHRTRATALAPLVDQASREHALIAGQLDEATRTAEEAGERLAAVDRQLASLAMPPGEGYAAADVAAIVTGLTPLIDPPGPDPLPVLMVDTYAGLGGLTPAALEATLVAAVRVQLVYTSDDPAVIEWAEGLASSAGQLVRLGKPNWFQRRLSRRARHQPAGSPGH